MNRRGFIGGLVGLAAGAAQVQEPANSSSGRIRTVIVDRRDTTDWLKSSEGERLVMFHLKKNSSFREMMKSAR